MNNRDIIQKQIINQGFLPLYYHENAETSISVLTSLYNGGVRIVEYTNRGANALSNFKEMLKLVREKMPEMKLGIGTIKTTRDAEVFIEAGADFIICPVVNPQVAKIVSNAGLLWIPGCMTPTEIHTAESNGATLVKLFPGNILGPTYVSGIRDLFPHLLFMPTGGVELNKENLQSWFDSGVCAVGFGSKFISKSIMENRQYEELQQLTIQAFQLIKSITR